MQKLTKLAVMVVLLENLSVSLLASGPVIATRAERAIIRSKPITQRENRPLHVYGNTVRRLNGISNSRR